MEYMAAKNSEMTGGKASKRVQLKKCKKTMSRCKGMIKKHQRVIAKCHKTVKHCRGEIKKQRKMLASATKKHRKLHKAMTKKHKKRSTRKHRK
jgi:hypothetical protein